MVQPSLTETDIKADIWRYLIDEAGALAVRVNSGQRGKLVFTWWQVKGLKRQTKGVPDIPIVLLKNGKLLIIDSKRPGESLTTEQQLFFAEAAARGHICIAPQSVEDVRRVVEGLGTG